MKNLSFVRKSVLVLVCVTLSLSAYAGDKCCKKKSAETKTPPTTVEPGKPAK